MNDLINGSRTEGEVCVDGEDIYDEDASVLRSETKGRHGFPEAELTEKYITGQFG